MINITLPDGSIKKVKKGTSAIEIAKNISEGLARNVLSASINDEVWDADRPITNDVTLKLHTFNDKEGKKTFWHSSAHIMAEALEILYPGVKLGIGPAIDNGFYYDIDIGSNVLSNDDLPKIEKKMKELASKKLTFERNNISKKDAIEYYKNKGDEYKLELLENLEDGDITFYTQGNFTDLCKGPHITSSEKIKAIKLLNIAGAYWKGDENRKQLTRIYGISFPKQKDLSEYLDLLEKAKKRDHRKIGKEMEFLLFLKQLARAYRFGFQKEHNLKKS